MAKKLKGIVLLIVFILGLIPGEYWIMLHQHKHGKIDHSIVSVHKTVRVCESQNHLYDFIKESFCFNSSTVTTFQPISESKTWNLPHPSFLSDLLRAPPAIG